jgi:hypothetical protein
VYLVCTAKPAFLGFWDFSVFGKSITYLFSAPLGGSIPSLATIFCSFLSLRSKPLSGVSCLLCVLHLLQRDSARGRPRCGELKQLHGASAVECGARMGTGAAH